MKVAQKQGSWILTEWVLSSVRQQVICRSQEQNSCFPSPSPKLQQWVLLWPQSCWHLLYREDVQVQKSYEIKSRKFTGCLRGRGYQKRPNGSLCSDCTGKMFPWWLAVKSRIWLLMSSRVTHVINGTAFWNPLDSCKILSLFFCLSPFLPPTPLSHFPFHFPSFHFLHTLSIFPWWWWTSLEKTASFRVCWGGGPVSPVTGAFMNSESYSKNI